MEKYSNIINSLEDVISCVRNSKEYNTCIKLKEQMEKNAKLKELIDEIKKLQQKYIKSHYDEKIKEQLEQKELILNNIPIYAIYNENLQVVNNMIDEIKISLNDYFNKKVNLDIEL